MDKLINRFEDIIEKNIDIEDNCGEDFIYGIPNTSRLVAKQCKEVAIKFAAYHWVYLQSRKNSPDTVKAKEFEELFDDFLKDYIK